VRIIKKKKKKKKKKSRESIHESNGVIKMKRKECVSGLLPKENEGEMG